MAAGSPSSLLPSVDIFRGPPPFWATFGLMFVSYRPLVRRCSYPFRMGPFLGYWGRLFPQLSFPLGNPRRSGSLIATAFDGADLVKTAFAFVPKSPDCLVPVLFSLRSLDGPSNVSILFFHASLCCHFTPWSSRRLGVPGILDFYSFFRWTGGFFRSLEPSFFPITFSLWSSHVDDLPLKGRFTSMNFVLRVSA